MSAWRDSALGCQPAFLWLASRLHDEDKRPGNEGKWGFYHPFPSHTVAGPHSPDCLYEMGVCACVRAHVCFCAGKLTKCVSHFPDGLAYGRTLAQGCSLQKSLTQLETHAENAQGLEHLYVTCVYTGECVWVLMQRSALKDIYLFLRYNNSAPGYTGVFQPSSFSNPSIPLF